MGTWCVRFGVGVPLVVPNPARNLDRQQSAELAAIPPSRLKRRPDRMTHYSALIMERMRQAGW